MERTDIIADVFEAAEEFHRRKLWKRFTNDDCFGLRIAGRDELMLGVVLGDAGEEYGLSLFRGPHAVSALTALLNPDGPGDDSLHDLDILGFSMEEFGDLTPDVQDFVRQACRHPKYKDQVPHFLAKPAGRHTRLPDESELALLRQVLRAVVAADKKKLLKPASLEDDTEICVLNVSREPHDPDVTWEKVEHVEHTATIRLLPATHKLRGLPRLKATWLAGMPVLPGAIEGEDRAMQLLLIVDQTRDLVLQGRPLFADDLKEAAKTVVDTFCGKGMVPTKGLPQKIIFSSSKLHDAMKPTLELLGVKCAYQPTIPELQEIVAEFCESMESGMDLTKESEDFADQDMEMPASDDLKGWKQADSRLYGRCIQQVKYEKRLLSSRAIKRYFDDEDFDYYIQEHGEQGAMAAFLFWSILDYRPSKKSRTHAEIMLERGLPGPEARLLRARMDTHPTLYRVIGHNAKAGTIELEDVLLGGTVTVYDQIMSENIEDNIFVAARAFPAGRFHFIEAAGPPLGPGMGLDAVRFLRKNKLQFTPEGLRQDAHKFGWLWQWMDEWQANWKPPRMCNTDGDELLWHTASFAVADPVLTRQRLMEREDIDYDQQADELVWSKQATGKNKMLGETITLGRIEFVADELVLTVNSAERFMDGRKWLEKLPGVAFKGVQTRPWDEAKKDRPLDERISPPESVEMTPEIVAAVQEMMSKRYMQWLDMPLPALGGKTPRQACRTEAGRQEVAMLIRTIPDPVGPASVRAPRQALLRELGLAGECPPYSPEDKEQECHDPIPILDVSSKPKAPRNAPCPCGSGRKYKKCCGDRANEFHA